jgi:hypothetical protein
MVVQELNATVWLANFFPEAPNPKILFPHVGVMHKDHSALAELGLPTGEILLDGLVSVEAINVEKVNATIGEVLQDMVRGGPKQTRESRISRLMIICQGLINFLSMEVTMGITLPGIHGVAGGGHIQFLLRLAEGAIGKTIVSAQFYEHLWS